MPLIEPATWRGVEALRLRGPEVSLTVVPSHGARIASIRDERHGHEWLVGAEGPDVSVPAYGDRYLDHPLAGWDEMLPTIDACEDPTTGAALPDHGDVWALPWSVEDDGASITTRVRARSLPLELSRTIAFEGERGVLLSYEVGNLGGGSVAWLWAAHPLFVAGPDTRLSLPGVVSVLQTSGPSVAGEERRYPWPPPPRARLDRIADGGEPADRKLFADPRQPVSAARLDDRSSGRSIAMTWDDTVVPYLGVWIDDGRWTPRGTIAIEPMSAFYDTPARAVALGTAPLLAPGERLRWWLRLSLS